MTSLKGFNCETQILKVKRIKICKSNNPAKGGGLKYPAAWCGKKFPKHTLGFHSRDLSSFFYHDLIHAVFFHQINPDSFPEGGGQVLSDKVGPDGQFAMTAVNQNSELNHLGAPEIN
jgi:hypothetical protein